jgi:hypothetical protein
MGLLAAIAFLWFVGRDILFEVLQIQEYDEEWEDWGKKESFGVWFKKNFLTKKK